MGTRLSVNVNAVAMLRNRRDLPWPSVTGIARIVMEAGAKGITIHPRPDERHIRTHDVFDLATLLSDEFPEGELCLEGYPDDRFLGLVEKVRPQQVLYVPDDPGQSTSDHGWDVPANRDVLTDIVGRSKSWGVRTALFMDPDPATTPLAAETGADRIEIYTGPYGGCFADPGRAAAELDKVVAAATAARAAGLGVNAGHDLTLDNLPALIARAPFIAEVSIGHCFAADALIYGAAEAVRRYQIALGELSVPSTDNGT